MDRILYYCTLADTVTSAYVLRYDGDLQALTARQHFYQRPTRLSIRLATVVSELARDVFLFLPVCCGDRQGNSVRFTGSRPRYWATFCPSDTQGAAFTAYSDSFTIGMDYRYTAYALRLATVVSGLVRGL